MGDGQEEKRVKVSLSRSFGLFIDVSQTPRIVPGQDSVNIC